MNKMQKMAIAVSLLAIAVLGAKAALSDPYDDGRRVYFVLAAISAVTGVVLLPVLARGDVLLQLQKCVAVVTLAASVATLTLARPLKWVYDPNPLGYIYVIDWVAKSTLAGCVLLAGVAMVVVLGFFRRNRGQSRDGTPDDQGRTRQ